MMIFDRVVSDIQKSIEILKKLKSGTNLTTNEKNTLEKGTLTVNTLNRIENKQAELSDILYQWRYLKEPLETKTWVQTDFFKASDMNRFVYNTNILRDSFFLSNSAIPYPTTEYTITAFNAIEETLQNVSDLVDNTSRLFQMSGAVTAGQSVLFPTK